MSSNDLEQFVRLLAQHDRQIYRYVLTLLPNASDAEDVLQETAAALWRKAETYDPAQPFFTWACGFARVEVMRFRRRASRRPLFDDVLLQTLADERAALQAELEARRVALDHCLELLTEHDHRLLERRYNTQASIADLARQSRIPAKRLYHALDRIRRRLMECITARLAEEGRA